MHVGEESRRLETLLATLAARTQEAAARGAEAARREAEAAEALAGATRVTERARTEARELRRAAEQEAQALLAEARRRVGQELDRLKTDGPTRRREAQEAYRQLRAAEATLHPVASARDEPAPPSFPGEVQLRGLGLRGRIVAEADGRVTVQADQFTVKVARSEIEPVTEARSRERGPSVSVPVREDVPRELHLLGFTTDEARVAVEKFLDDAALAGHRELRLIHGKGTGALRRAVEGCLRGHPLVTSFRLAEPSGGGAGATVVALEGAEAAESLARRRGPRVTPGRRASR
jgi:DNA mismatch repair protein MutS2